MKKQTLIRGTFILGVAGIFARFLGLFFRIPLQLLIGDEGMGYYHMSYPLYMTFIAVASGIPIAISKIIAEMNANKDNSGIKYVLKSTLLIMVPVALIFSGVIMIFAKDIIIGLKWHINSYYAFMAIALAPVFVVIMGTFRGFFQGLQNMNPTAISQIIEQVGRVVGGVGLAYLLFPKGIAYAAGGAALGAVAGAILGMIYLLMKYHKVSKEITCSKNVKKKYVIGDILKNAIPFSMGAVIGTIMGLVDSILVPRQLLKAGYSIKKATILYGQLTGKAGTLANVPLALSMALCASIVPIIAESYISRRNLELKSKVENAIKLSNIISIPSAMGLFFMAYPVMALVYQGDAAGYTILKYLAISLPFIVICQCSTVLLQAMNRFYDPVKNLAIGCIVKVVVTYVLVPIPYINIYGAIIGSVLGYMVACILNMHLLRTKTHITINYYEVTIKPAYASVLMIIAVVFIYRYVYNITMSNTIACLISILIGVVVYSIFILVFKVFKYSEIKKRLPKKYNA